MYKRNLIIVLNVLISLLVATQFCAAQGTAFTYQGNLSSTNGAATGSYDLQFALFNASTGGTQVGATINDTGTSVSNGFFTVVLDFGNVFAGADTWLQISVRTNGGGSYETLSPRQELTPTPYAITAENVDGPLPASQLTGTLPSGLLAGTYADPLTLNNAGNAFTGNGSGLTGVNALTLGNLGANNFWQTTGNSGTLPGVNFVGTTDGAALELSAPFVGVNRTNAVTGSDVFSVTAPATAGNYGGMYVDTASIEGLPFYGYSVAGIDAAWTYLDGADSYKWKLYNEGVWLTVTEDGLVGIDLTDPLATLDIQGGNWAVYETNQFGDFRIGDAADTLGLRIGVATAGSGAGDSRIFAYGGTSRLILGSSNYDNVITVWSNNVGINTLTPAADASLDVEGTNLDGIQVFNSAYLGNGIYSVATGTAGYGVWGLSYASYGVVGTGEGEGDSGTTGVYGQTSDTNGVGVVAEGATASSPALAISQGSFQVSGAGVNTSTTAFIQYATATNTSSYITIIYNPICDGDPNAILIATHNWNPPGVTGNYETHPYSVYYADPHWTIYNDDKADITGMSFNVLVIKN